MALTIDPRYYDAAIFDLDGVVADTAGLDAVAWTQVADYRLSPAARPSRRGSAPLTQPELSWAITVRPLDSSARLT